MHNFIVSNLVDPRLYEIPQLPQFVLPHTHLFLTVVTSSTWSLGHKHLVVLQILSALKMLALSSKEPDPLSSSFLKRMAGEIVSK